MPDYWDGFVAGAAIAVVVQAAISIIVMCWPEVRTALRWLGRGLREFASALRSILQPPPQPPPAWVRRMLERIRR